MAHASKLKYAGIQSQNKVDRISTLPDAFLCHILSFLPTKEAVATSILSTRWRYLFSSLPDIHLDFDDCLLRLHPESGRRYLDIESPHYRQFSEFINFGYRLILLRNGAPIRKFHLGLNEFIERYRLAIDSLIFAALSCKIQQLEICLEKNLCKSNPLCSPGILSCPKIFRCETLSDLNIRTNRNELYVPNSVFLPNLKVLSLSKFKLVDEYSVPRLVKGCPLLRELTLNLYDHVGVGVDTLEITSPSLEKLYLECMLTGPWALIVESTNLQTLHCKVLRPYETILNAPKLEYLQFQGGGEVKLVQNMNALVESRISFSQFIGETVTTENSQLQGQTAFVLINGSRTVESLGVSDDALELLYSPRPLLPNFENLTYLEIEVGMNLIVYSCFWEMLSRLLGSAPKLRVIVFGEVFWDDHEEQKFEWLFSNAISFCLLEYLREVEIKKLKGKDYEFKLIEYLLQYGKALKHITLGKLPNSEDENRILSCKKCSEGCRIFFNDDSD